HALLLLKFADSKYLIPTNGAEAFLQCEWLCEIPFLLPSRDATCPITAEATRILKILQAARNYHWSDIYHYPDPFHEGLRQAAIQFWADFSDLKGEQIQIASGAMAVLERLNKIFIEKGSTVLGYSPQFTEYVTEIEASGGRYEAVVLKPEENFEFNTQRLLKMMSRKHCLVYLDNPNNPTGQVIGLEKVEEIILETGKKGIVVIIDEAFGDYWGRENSAIKLVNKYQNLIVVR
ncbi:unnamed protein product, partial [marine sediment metagenome]